MRKPIDPKKKPLALDAVTVRDLSIVLGARSSYTYTCVCR